MAEDEGVRFGVFAGTPSERIVVTAVDAANSNVEVKLKGSSSYPAPLSPIGVTHDPDLATPIVTLTVTLSRTVTLTLTWRWSSRPCRPQ